MEAATTALHSNDSDIVLLSLFTWASYRLSYVPTSLPIAAVLDLINSARRREDLCAGKTASSREDVERKLRYWAYRALVRIAKISKPSMLFATRELAKLLKEAFETTTAASRDANTIETLFQVKEAQNTTTNAPISVPYALPPLQLELLLQMPVATEVAFLVQPCLDACPAVCANLR
jgi:hypothetical protein